MKMRAIIPAMAMALGIAGLSGCADPGPYNTTSYVPAPTTTTTTTVVRDANGNNLSTAQTVRDANGNPMVAAPGVYQTGPGYYQYAPGYGPPPPYVYSR
jgi:hypothetical protein